jgi:hypothetical protein
MAINIPEPLQELAELAVKKVFKKNRLIPDLKPLHDWFEDAGVLRCLLRPSHPQSATC